MKKICRTCIYKIPHLPCFYCGIDTTDEEGVFIEELMNGNWEIECVTCSAKEMAEEGDV